MTTDEKRQYLYNLKLQQEKQQNITDNTGSVYKGVTQDILDSAKQKAQDFDTRSPQDKEKILANVMSGQDPYFGIEGPKNDTPVLGGIASFLGNLGRSAEEGVQRIRSSSPMESIRNTSPSGNAVGDIFSLGTGVAGNTLSVPSAFIQSAIGNVGGNIANIVTGNKTYWTNPLENAYNAFNKGDYNSLGEAALATAQQGNTKTSDPLLSTLTDIADKFGEVGLDPVNYLGIGAGTNALKAREAKKALEATKNLTKAQQAKKVVSTISDWILNTPQKIGETLDVATGANKINQASNVAEALKSANNVSDILKDTSNVKNIKPKLANYETNGLSDAEFQLYQENKAVPTLQRSEELLNSTPVSTNLKTANNIIPTAEVSKNVPQKLPVPAMTDREFQLYQQNKAVPTLQRSEDLLNAPKYAKTTTANQGLKDLYITDKQSEKITNLQQAGDEIKNLLGKNLSPKIIQSETNAGVFNPITKTIGINRELNDPLFAARHEIVHYASDIAKTKNPKLYNAAIDQIIKENGRKGLIDLYHTQGYTDFGIRQLAEEHLANHFENFLDGRPTSLTGKIKEYIDHLVNTVQTIFGKGDAVKKMYSDIAGGKYKDYIHAQSEMIGKEIPLKINGDQKKIAETLNEAQPGLEGNKVSQLSESIKGSPNLSEGLKNTSDYQYLQRSNKELSTNAENYIKANGIDNTKSELLKKELWGDNEVAQSQHILKYYDTKGMNEEALNWRLQMIPKSIETGRSAQAWSLLNKVTPDNLINITAKELAKRGKTLSLEQQTKIGELLDAYKGAKEGDEKSRALFQALDYVQKQMPSSPIDKVLSLWKAGLLTGVKTSSLNISSNLTNQVLENIKDVPSTAFDKIISLFSGQRTKTLGGVANVGEQFSGFKKGLGQGWDYFKTGYDPSNIGLKYLDNKQVNFGKSFLGKAAQKYTDTVFRVLGSQDRPFYWAAFNKSLADQAWAKAFNEGAKGAERSNMIKNLIKNPEGDMMVTAAKDAQKAVFQNPTVLNNVAGALKNKARWTEFIIPFSKTPSAIAMQVISYTPAGYIKTLAENIGKGKFNQRQLVEGLGRATTGTGIAFIGWILASKGLINGAYPTDEKERALWEAENRQPNSIKIGDKYISLAGLGPAGSVLSSGAAAYKAAVSNEDVPTIAGSTVFGGIRPIMESPTLTGISNVLDATKNLATGNTSAVSNFINSTTSSVVPTLISDISRATDTNDQGQTLTRNANNPIESIINKTPARRVLPVDYDIMGEPRTSGSSPIDTIFNPLKPQQATQNAATNEIRRLVDSGQDISINREQSKSTRSVAGMNVKLTKEQLNNLQKDVGEKVSTKLNQLIASPNYQNLSDDKKAQVINKLIRATKTTNTNQVLKSTLQSKLPEILNIRRQYKQGLITKQEALNQISKLS